MFGGVGGSEVLLVVLLVLVLFGSKRMPELARGLGRAMRELRQASRRIRREIESAEPPARPGSPDGDSDRVG